MAHSTPSKTHIIENFSVVWLDPEVNAYRDSYKQPIQYIRSIVNAIEIFNEKHQCLQYLYTNKDERIFFITSGGFGQEIIEDLEKLFNIIAVYIFCYDKKRHSQWAKNYSKIKGVFTDIKLLRDMLKKDIRQSNSDLTSFTTITSDQVTSALNEENSLNKLTQDFMYTQLLKEILLDIKYDQYDKEKFIEFSRENYQGNDLALEVIEEFEEFYPRRPDTKKSSPIWWYTRECFIYKMLNKALRSQDIHIILHMAFFIQDLHKHLKKLHTKIDQNTPLIVYRGQGLSQKDFQRLQDSNGGLLSFNVFLSTSTDEDKSWPFVKAASKIPEHVGVFFIMKIDPKLSSTPFALLDKESFFGDAEKEILFSMHTIFRIDDIKSIQNRIWKVELTLTSDHDPQLAIIADCMRKELTGKTGWHRLASLLTKMGEFTESLRLYENLLKQANDWEDLSYLHHQFGYLYKQQGNLDQALIEYQKSLDIKLEHYSSDHHYLSPTYSNIGEIYRLQHNLDGALEHFERALTIEQKSPHPNQLHIASYYNNIGMVASKQREYAKALSNYENTLAIKLKQLPPFHPSLAITYNNIGTIHFIMRDFAKANEYFQKAFDVEVKYLPPTHYSLAETHNQLAVTFDRLDRNEQALEHARKAVEIAQHTYQKDHKQIKSYQQLVDKLSEKLASF